MSHIKGAPKGWDPRKVGQTYGERQHAKTEQQGNTAQQTESNSFFKKFRDFFSVDPKIAASAFSPNSKFLEGANIHPLQGLSSSGPRQPGISLHDALAQIDRIEQILNSGPKKG